MLGPRRTEAALPSPGPASCGPSPISDIGDALIPCMLVLLAGARESLDQRQFVVLVERWWRRQRPFERGRACAPRIVAGFLLAHEGMGDAEEEHQGAESREIGAERRH